jgi:eukaryotic-like serine/threonine-protein kinase
MQLLARKLLRVGLMTLQANSAPPDAEPRVIAKKYRLESLLGEGGMGSVWRAFNLQLEVPVAIKLLRPDLNNDELSERLRVEARAAAKLVHPSIVRVFDIGEAESGDPFIVMELLNGESLGARIQRGALSPVEALQILLPIAEALSLAHSRGVVHRDLKPDNVFLATDGSTLQPKLLDFGIAKVTSALATGGAILTQTGVLLGSPDYMSPEQAYGQADIDHRSDVWSFCAMLYEAISGEPPFIGSSCQQILRSVVQDEPVPLEMVCGTCPALSRSVMRGLSKDREARPSSIFELGQELAGWLMGQGVLEDVTGSSLEAKWFGRGVELPGSARGHAAPRAQHEHATLMSVVHPSPRPPSEPLLEITLRGNRRWAPAAAAVASLLAVAGVGLTWAALQGEPPALGTAAATTPMPAPVAAAQLERVPDAEPASLPAAVGAVVEPEAKLTTPEPKPKPAVVLAAQPAPLRAAPPTRTAGMQTTTGHAATLPQALPTRDTHSDLLNPY